MHLDLRADRRARRRVRWNQRPTAALAVANVAVTCVVLADSTNEGTFEVLAVYAIVVAMPLAFSDRATFGIACLLVTIVSALAVCVGFMLPGAILLLLLAQIRISKDWTRWMRAIYFAAIALVGVMTAWIVR